MIRKKDIVNAKPISMVVVITTIFLVISAAEKNCHDGGYKYKRRLVRSRLEIVVKFFGLRR